MTAPTRPVLRYHGGKWRLAPWILSFFPPHRVYVEPFGGAASVLMRKPRSYGEVYNDLDGAVVSLFRVLRKPHLATQLRRELELTPYARAEFELAYEPTDDPIEAARRLIIRAFMGHGATGIRAHRTGFRRATDRRGTVPAHDWARWPAEIPAIVERLQGVIIEERDAFEVIADQDRPDALFYADPPYVHSTRVSLLNGHKHHYRAELTDDGHRRIALALRGARGMVVLSGYACELYDKELYPDWERHETDALADGARERTEVVWLNPACSAALRSSRAQLELA